MLKKFQKLIALAMMFWAVATDVNAESYVCMFDCFNSSQKCQTAFERNDLNLFLNCIIEFEDVIEKGKLFQTLTPLNCIDCL